MHNVKEMLSRATLKGVDFTHNKIEYNVCIDNSSSNFLLFSRGFNKEYTDIIILGNMEQATKKIKIIFQKKWFELKKTIDKT